MTTIRLEITEFADLLRDAVNLTQPVFVESFSYRKWFINLTLSITALRLEAVRAAGTVIVLCHVNQDRRQISVNAEFPQFYLQIPYSIAGGGKLVNNRIRNLEILLDGGVKGEVKLADTRNGFVDIKSVDVDVSGFKVQFHILPAWVERRLQRPIEKAIERGLEKVIIRSARMAIIGNFTPQALKAPIVSQSGGVNGSHQPRRGLFSRLTYASAYYLAFGVSYPAILVANSTNSKSSMARGLADGAVTAQRDVRSLRKR